MADATYPVRKSFRFKQPDGEFVCYEPDYVARDKDAGPAGSLLNAHKDIKCSAEQAERLKARGLIGDPPVAAGKGEGS